MCAYNRSTSRYYALLRLLHTTFIIVETVHIQGKHQSIFFELHISRRLLDTMIQQRLALVWKSILLLYRRYWNRFSYSTCLDHGHNCSNNSFLFFTKFDLLFDSNIYCYYHYYSLYHSYSVIHKAYSWVIVSILDVIDCEWSNSILYMFNNIQISNEHCFK